MNSDIYTLDISRNIDHNKTTLHLGISIDLPSLLFDNLPDQTLDKLIEQLEDRLTSSTIGDDREWIDRQLGRIDKLTLSDYMARTANLDTLDDNILKMLNSQLPLLAQITIQNTISVDDMMTYLSVG